MSQPIRVHLEAEYQRRAAPETVSAAVRTILPHPLQHQVETAAALATHDMVINAFPTGTGKTKAALLWLLDHPQANILLVAPVNELVRQHAQDAEQFVAAAGLPHVVESVDAAFLRTLPEDLGKRPGERFYRILTNPASLPKVRHAQRTIKPPLLLVTNPDLFYYGVFYLFNHLDRRNIAEQFIARFQYVIIDEVHYYDAKQFANLLFFILLSKEFGYFSSGLPELRKICLLTATPDSDFNHFVERLEQEGITVKRLDPQPVSPDDPLATKSLTEVELELHPYTRDAAGEFLQHTERIAEFVEQGKDGALLLNSLYGVNRLAREFERRLGRDRVGRITGPLSKEERQQAPHKPLLLATPMVDIGFNFEGRPKERQNLDFVGFEAPWEDRFWQRLGRAGRVLGKRVQDVPSIALAFIPDEPLKNLRRQIGEQATLSRAQLKGLLHEAAGERMQRPSFTEYVSSYAFLEIAQPLSEMERLLGENADIVERVFDSVKRVYAPSSKKQFWSLKGEIRRYQGFRRLQEELRKTEAKLDEMTVRAMRELAQEEHGKILAQDEAGQMTRQVFSNPKAKLELQKYVSREVAVLQPVFSFRDADIGVEVTADDPKGLVSSLRESVPLDLFHLLRFYDWSLNEEPSRTSPTLHVVLQEILQPPLKVGLTLRFDGKWEDFRKRYTKKPTALHGLKLSRQTQGAFVSTVPRMMEAIAQRYVPCLVLEQDNLKEWQWGSLSRDGVYFIDLEVTFTESSFPKSLRLFSGLDGYRVMGRYGWSIQRTTGEWWVV
ncbi:MAG: type I-D CRISPR-associated helicase Cas3' [Deltaproteobacteria bacterium]|nr:type I-D CRISPR-associated helicase Cas3' [Deltaproteobacteria bacterium]